MTPQVEGWFEWILGRMFRGDYWPLNVVCQGKTVDKRVDRLEHDGCNRIRTNHDFINDFAHDTNTVVSNSVLPVSGKLPRLQL